MRMGVVVRTVPDLVEGIEVEESGIKPFRYILNETDEHAVEEAIILKEKYGGEVEAIGIGDEEAEVEENLYTVVARGVDKAVNVVLNRKGDVAKVLSEFLKDKKFDLILIGTQAIDEFIGMLGPMLAAYMNLPYIGNVVHAELGDGFLVIRKELGGGLFGDFKVKIPAIVGIQAAEKPLRYIPFSKLREAMKVELETINLDVSEVEIKVEKYYEPPKPEIVLLEGDPEKVADGLVKAFMEIGVFR